jgi:hypothetical protein
MRWSWDARFAGFGCRAALGRFSCSDDLLYREDPFLDFTYLLYEIQTLALEDLQGSSWETGLYRLVMSSGDKYPKKVWVHGIQSRPLQGTG